LGGKIQSRRDEHLDLERIISVIVLTTVLRIFKDIVKAMVRDSKIMALLFNYVRRREEPEN
jgi:hypothetical protein